MPETSRERLRRAASGWSDSIVDLRSPKRLRRRRDLCAASTAPSASPRSKAALAELRPRLQLDGGDCELVDIVEDVVRVRLTGACVGCQLASMTVLGVRMRLIERLGFPVKVVPV